MLIMSIVIFYYLGKVNRNANLFSNKRSLLSRKLTDGKLFVEDSESTLWRLFKGQELFKTLFKIICVAPRF